MNEHPPVDAQIASLEAIDEKSAGQRIDNFLRRLLKGVPKDRIHRGLRRGEIRVNKGRIRASYKLCLGDVVRIPPLKIRASITTREPPEHLISMLRSRILHEDDEILVIDKPAGISVHRGTDTAFGIIEILRTDKPKDRYLELVHRLDRDTSGCLVIAKTRPSLTHLHALLRGGALRKGYLVLVRGKWKGGSRKVVLPLKKSQLRSGERMVAGHIGGKAAVTHFNPIGRCPGGSLLAVSIDTGRTHQIRVHAESIGFPVAGDTKYGDKSFNRQCRAWGLRRMFLHANEIAYERNGSTFRCVSPLGEDLVDTLRAIGLGPLAKKLV